MAQQTLKIGLPGLEQELPNKSRSMLTEEYIEKSRTGEALDGTRKKDFVASKKRLVWNYNVLTEATRDLINNIYQLQIDNGTPLSIIYTEAGGVEKTLTGFMSPPSFGSLVQQDTLYKNGVSIEINEV